MLRTLINLDSDDKAWLDRQARARHLPMTELVRQAVRSYREREESRNQPRLQDALAQTAGIWRHGESLAWQRRLRDEWERTV